MDRPKSADSRHLLLQVEVARLIDQKIDELRAQANTIGIRIPDRRTNINATPFYELKIEVFDYLDQLTEIDALLVSLHTVKDIAGERGTEHAN
jgi:hypothetical protein